MRQRASSVHDVYSTLIKRLSPSWVPRCRGHSRNRIPFAGYSLLPFVTPPATFPSYSFFYLFVLGTVSCQLRQGAHRRTLGCRCVTDRFVFVYVADVNEGRNRGSRRWLLNVADVKGGGFRGGWTGRDTWLSNISRTPRKKFHRELFSDSRLVRRKGQGAKRNEIAYYREFISWWKLFDYIFGLLRYTTWCRLAVASVAGP